MFSDPGKEGNLFGAWTIFSGAATQEKGKKGATEQLRLITIPGILQCTGPVAAARKWKFIDRVCPPGAVAKGAKEEGGSNHPKTNQKRKQPRKGRGDRVRNQKTRRGNPLKPTKSHPWRPASKRRAARGLDAVFAHICPISGMNRVPAKVRNRC